MSYVKEMFGKKYKELTPEERTLYQKSIKGLDLRSKSLCRQKYGKGYNELTRAEKTSCYYIKGSKYKETKAYKIFGKRYKELTDEEKRAFVKTFACYVDKLKNTYRESFCWNYFGKRHNELNGEERREFNRIRKKESRKRTGRN